MRSAITAILLLGLAFGCSKREPPRQYRMRGYVVRIDPHTNVAIIHNEKVEGWMEEMTMEYPIESRDEYRALRKGEKIEATANVSSEGYWLTNVRPAQ